MATPPLRTEISDTYPNPTNAVARSGFGKLYDYVTGLLGATGDAAEARTALGVDEPSSLIHTTNDETKAGVLTFTNSPLVPDPTADDDAANKGYVDSLVAAYKASGTVITTTGVTLTNATAGEVVDINSATATATTLMAISSLADGQSFTLTNIGAGIATFNRAGADTITGGNLVAATSLVLNRGETVTLSRVNSSFRVTGSNVSFYGAPQTWQDVTAGRAINTTYTNTTGRPISVSVQSTLAGVGIAMDLVVGGVTIKSTSFTSSTTVSLSNSAIVPNGASYSLSTTRVLASWVELR